MEVISDQLIVSLHVSNSQCELILSNKFSILWNGDDWTWRYISSPLRSWSFNIQHKIACCELFSWNSLHSSHCFPQWRRIWINPHFVKKSFANVLWNYFFASSFPKVTVAMLRFAFATWSAKNCSNILVIQPVELKQYNAIVSSRISDKSYFMSCFLSQCLKHCYLLE